jgi:hypothetical protein
MKEPMACKKCGAYMCHEHGFCDACVREILEDWENLQGILGIMALLSQDENEKQH